MTHLILVTAKRQADPAAMKIGGFGTDACFDQHLSRLNIRRFDGYPIVSGADAGKHLAANLPGIMASAPRVGKVSAWKRAADGIDKFSAHGRKGASP